MCVRPKHPYTQNKNKQVIKRFENKNIIKCMEIKQGDKKKESWVLVTVDEVFCLYREAVDRMASFHNDTWAEV